MLLPPSLNPLALCQRINLW